MICTGSMSADYHVTETLAYGFAAFGARADDSATVNFAAGTGAGKIDLHWEKGIVSALTLAGGASVTYTLSALTSGTSDDLGRTVAFVHLSAIFVGIVTAAPVAGDKLTLAPGATHGFDGLSTSAITIKTFFHWADKTGGLAITAGVKDQITIANPGATSITFHIGLAGTST